MPPKRTRYDRKIREALDANTPITYKQNSSVAHLGSLTLTNNQGLLNERGQRYEELARERGLNVRVADTDAWNRGTTTRGQSEYASRRSGKTKVVARWRNGILQPTRLGDEYYGLYAQEYLLHIPVLFYSYERNALGRYISATNHIETTIPLHEFTMENLNGLREEPGAERLRQLRFGRTRDSNEWTLEQKWNYVLQAFTRFIDSEKALGEAKYNSDGHLVLIYASDGYYAIKESTYQSAQNLESRGFRLQELRAKYQKGIGLLPMEVLMHRPLGNNPNYTPCEFYNKSSLYPLAFTDMNLQI